MHIVKFTLFIVGKQILTVLAKTIERIFGFKLLTFVWILAKTIDIRLDFIYLFFAAVVKHACLTVDEVIVLFVYHFY